MINNINEIYIWGKLPFPLLIEDSIDDQNELIKNNSFFNILSEDGNILAEVGLKLVINQSQSTISLAVEDPTGTFTYSTFLVKIRKAYLMNGKTFKDLIMSDSDGKLSKEHLSDISHEIISKLLEAYKYNTQKYWIPIVSKANLSPFKIEIRDINNNIIDQVKYMDFRGTGIGIGSKISNDVLDKIKRICVLNNIKIDPASEILHEANRFMLNGNYMAAAIYISVYFEKIIIQETIRKFMHLGLTESDINLRLKKNNGKYIHRYKAIQLFTKSEKYKIDARFLNYEKYIVEPRNEIIHNERYIFTKEIVEKMISVGNESSIFFSEIIWRDLYNEK